jgi:hypothetical protein
MQACSNCDECDMRSSLVKYFLLLSWFTKSNASLANGAN